MSSPAWLTSVMPCRSSVNCTPVAVTGVGVVELLVMVTVVVTISPGSITPSPSVSLSGVSDGGLDGGEGLVGHVVTS